MKLFILSTLLAACLAAPQNYQNPQYTQLYNQYTPYNQQYRVSPNIYQDTYRPRAGLERSAAILRSDSQVNENGFNYAFETENGIQAQESGVEANGIQAQGSYSYTGDDGKVYSVRYTAGANGFQAEGAHLPTPPPVPAAIARALQLNARDEASGIYDDGSYTNGRYNTAYPSVVAARYYPQNPKVY